MRRKIFKTGNSVVVTLPKHAMEYLQVGEGSEVNVELYRENNQIVISPVQPNLTVEGINPEFAHQVAVFIEEYQLALVELAR